VLHAFHKKTQKTALRDLDIGRKQYKALLEELKS
jgi:phage-related protein